ncbi:MAG TPA: hypothetical protein VM142_14010 [Acidimicrobiales bacterium]|nr:hypothetical protein [Acidimicrobiales bacterium]
MEVATSFSATANIRIPGRSRCWGSRIGPRTIRSDLDPEVADFLVKACSPDRSERFATAQEMKGALVAVRSRGDSHA